MLTISSVISTFLDVAERRIVKIYRLGKSDVQSVIEAAPYGVDGNPIKKIRAIYAPSRAVGRPIVLGYITTKRKADVGELRLFSTDADGDEEMFVWLKNDGTLEVGGDTDNLVRFSDLKDGFDELKDNFNDLVTAFNAHVHAGNGIPPTAVPGSIPAIASAATIDGAKIEEIKTL